MTTLLGSKTFSVPPLSLGGVRHAIGGILAVLEHPDGPGPARIVVTLTIDHWSPPHSQVVVEFDPDTKRFIGIWEPMANRECAEEMVAQWIRAFAQRVVNGR